MTVPADVVVYGSPSDGAVERIQQIWAGVGLTARVAVVEPVETGASWLVVATIPVRLVYEQLAAEASHQSDGGSAASRLADAVRQLARPPSGVATGLVLLQDTETGLEIVVPPGLPEAAFESLAAVDLASYTFGPLHYDVDTARWRSIMDEWSPA